MVFTPLSITSLRSVTVGFGKVNAFCLNHDCRMFFQPWIVYISKDVGREDIRGLNMPWQSLHYTLGSKLIINDGQLLSWFP